MTDPLDEFDLRVFGLDQAVAQQYWDSFRSHLEHVREAAKMLGLDSYRADQHDASKLREDEFVPYAQHFYGKDDPDAFTMAWLLHIHRNDHHIQHWVFPAGCEPGQDIKNDGVAGIKDPVLKAGIARMPDECVLEMVADWLGASKVYTGSWNLRKWLGENLGRVKLHLHPESWATLTGILNKLGHRVTETVRQKKDGWHLYSMDGSKHLGGPYPDRQGALDREKQVQMFKHGGSEWLDQSK